MKQKKWARGKDHIRTCYVWINLLRRPHMMAGGRIFAGRKGSLTISRPLFWLCREQDIQEAKNSRWRSLRHRSKVLGFIASNVSVLEKALGKSVWHLPPRIRHWPRTILLDRKAAHDEGDRSHPRLVALDSLRLSYPGWEEDVKAYEERHVSFNSISGFERTPEESSVQIAIFKSKQKKYDVGIEDSSWMHPDQHIIVNTEWTFPGWEKGVQRVRESTSTYFPELEQFQVRQMLHENDYTRHPLLIKLGSIELSYPGWDKDIDNIKRKVVKSCFWKDNFEQKMQGMLNKQRAYNGYLRSMIRDIPGDENGSTNSKVPRFEGNAEKTGVKECVVCWVAPRTHVFVPCGHMCAYKSCSKTMIGSTTKCPACNQTATASIEVFFP